MPDTNDKIKALYNAASQKFDIGTEQEFRQKLTDSSKRKAFYDAAVSEFDLGTYDEYEKKIGPTQKSIDEGKAMAAKVPSFKDFAAERGVYVPKLGEIAVASDISERLPSLTTKANIAKDVQEAPERIKVREERKVKAQADALKNNTIKALTANGTKFTEGDAAFKKMQESIKSVVDKGAMTLSADAAGNPIYKRSAGVVESIINNFEASRKDIVDSEIFRKSDLAESVKIAEGIIKGIEQEAVPSGAAAEIAGMVGSSLPLLGRAVIGGGVASKFLPGPAKALAALGSFAATISPSYDQAYKQGAVELYAKGLDEIKRQKRIDGLSDELTQQDKEDAMDRAKKEASVSGFAEGIFTAGLSSIPLGAPVAGQSFKKALVNFAKNTAKEVPRNVSLGAASEVIKDVSARNAGYNITTAETLNNVLERSGQDALTTLAFEVGFNLGGAANVPKYVKAAASNYLSTIPAPEFNNFAKDLEGRGVVEQGFAEKAAADVNRYKDAKSKVASFIPEDDMPSFAGLIEKKTNLENQKKTTDPSFHAKIDEQIAAVDERIKKMQESPNPIFDEVDELTGDTGDATPVTQQEIEKSIEYADGFAPEVAKMPEEIASLKDDEQKIFTVKSIEEVPEQFRDRAKKKEGAQIEIREKIFGLPIGKKTTTTIGDGYSYILTGKEAKDLFAQKQQQVPEPTQDIETEKAEIEKRRREELFSVSKEMDTMNEEELARTASDRIAKRVAIDEKYDAEIAALEKTTAPTEVKPEQEVERLRAEEQQELASAIPNIDEYKTEGVVDRNKITNEEDLKKFDEIYNKYDKLITPLLEAPKETQANTRRVVEPTKKQEGADYGSGGMVKFAEGVEIPYKYKIVESKNVKPSHLPSGERNPEHSIALAQPKERGDIQSKLAQEKIAKNPNLGEVGQSPNPYFGAPIVNARGEVIQGNNRSLGLKRHYNEGGSSYKKQLAENAEKFGMTPEQVQGMENPILVREAPIDDAMAVELGNYDVKDLETGGKQRIDPIVTVRKMTPEDKNKLAALIFDGEYNTVKEAIRENQQQVGSLISKQINAAQRNTIFDKEGNINQKGMEDIENIVNNMLFESGPAVLPEAFSELSYNQQKNIQKAIKHIFNTPDAASILPEVQNAVLGLYDFRKSGIDNFNAWLSTIDIFEGKTPRDIFTPVEIKMMETLVKAKNQSELSKQLSAYAELVRGKPADMFEPERAGISKQEAIKKTFNVEYENITKRYAEPESKVADEGAILAEEPELTIERATADEQSEFNDFAKREVEREGFDAEYKSARVEGETKEQYLVRKYCK